MKRLLLTGVSGFLGYNIARLARDDWEVHGIVFSHLVAIPGIHIHRADLTCKEELGRLFREIRPHAVIHAARIDQSQYLPDAPG